MLESSKEKHVNTTSTEIETIKRKLTKLAKKVELLEQNQLPSGTIALWSGETPPPGWTICNGQNGTPDLRDRFVCGSGGKIGLGSHTKDEDLPLPGEKRKFEFTIKDQGRHSHHLAPIPPGEGVEGVVVRLGPAKPLVGGVSSSDLRNWAVTTGPDIHVGKHDHTGHVEIDSFPPYHTLTYIMKL